MVRIRRSPPAEVWKPVVSHPGNYEVSSLGRVRRVLLSGGFRFLKISPDDNGRPRANLSSNYHRRNVLVSGLVAEAFLVERPNGMLVCHRDGNPKNNKWRNLRYGTQASNMQDMLMHGTACIGSKSSMSKLTESDVAEIKRMLRTNRLSDISELFNVSVATISMIKNGYTWKHVK